MATLFMESLDSKGNIIVEEIETTIKAEDFQFKSGQVFQENEGLPNRTFINIDSNVNKKKIIEKNLENKKRRKKELVQIKNQLETNIEKNTKKIFKGLNRLTLIEKEIINLK